MLARSGSLYAGMLLRSRCLFVLRSFPLADIGEGIRDVEITKWFVKVGDVVREFDPICEVRSDKATAEITSRYEGCVTKIYHPEVGATQLVGQPLVDIECEDTNTAAIPTTSCAVEVDAPAPSEASPSLSARAAVKFQASPAVRSLLRQHQLCITDIQGTGRDGRVTKEDVLLFVQRASKFKAQEADARMSRERAQQREGEQSDEVALLAAYPGVKVQPLRGIRRAMARSMERVSDIPTFTCSEEIDVGLLMRLRNELKSEVEAYASTHRIPIKLTLTPFFLKAASLALTHYPLVNARYLSGERIALIPHHHIGFAVDSPEGLLVPKVRHCEARSLLEIAQEVTNLTDLGRRGKLTSDMLSDGTITLSNIGTIGATYTSPTLLYPEVAIGALGRIQQLPRFRSEKLKQALGRADASTCPGAQPTTVPANCVEVANIMCTSWTADHRVLDGATMVRFLMKFKSFLENPAQMVLHLK